MSYRSIKRVLGETNLERKCRILFGICLFLLVGAAFLWVDRVAEELVIETTRSKGRDLIDIAMLRDHFEAMNANTAYSGFAKQVSEDLLLTDYQFEVLTLNSDFTIQKINAKPPADAEEEAILRQIQQQIDDRPPADEKKPEQRGGNPQPAPLPPVFADRRMPENDEYAYYQPIVWDNSCTTCHSTPLETGVASASEGGPALGIKRPLHVMKVTIGYKETASAINKTRAIMIAVAILTVFFAMVALYGIVRYVIVKPLQHLQNVSDDISRGETDLRAELNTGDEFQELAASFNRMLHHLTQTQRDLRVANTTLDGKVDELAQLNMRLYEMNQMKSEFLANMSHELRTPLNSIIGFSEVLQGINSLNDKQKRYAENIRKSGRLLLEMINDILDLAKLEAGKMQVRPTEFHIETLVIAHCDMVRSLTEDKNIDLTCHVVAGLPALFQDQAKVQQILTNLLSNAIKFTPEGGRISVSARRTATDMLELKVEDTGVGIADEDREIIFEKFRQGPALVAGDNLTREYSGTGLGLSIVRELCKLLGGEILLESELGKGTTFRILLPWTATLPVHVDEVADAQEEFMATSSLEPEARAGIVVPAEETTHATSADS